MPEAASAPRPPASSQKGSSGKGTVRNTTAATPLTAAAESVVVNNVSLDNEADGFVQLAGGDVPPVYSVTQTYSVMWVEK